jgi:hypothetical protein
MPKPEKILRMTKDYWNLRTSAALIMPFAPRFETPYKFYLDKSREYDRVYGVNSGAKFFEDFPEYFEFSASLSKNPTGVQSSIAATKNIKKYGELIGEVVKIDAKLVGLIVNDPSGYEFSQSAYDYLYKKRVSADAPDRFLSSQSPAESQRKTDAEKGWVQYNKFMDILEQEFAEVNWFNKLIFEKYLTLGSLKKVSINTSITLPSIGRYVKETKQVLKFNTFKRYDNE